MSLKILVHDWVRLVEQNEAEPITWEINMQRTPQQNKALHKYCQMVADDMNAAGYDAQTVISLPIQLTGAIVKDQIFKVIMNGMNQDLESTTELTKAGDDDGGVSVPDVVQTMQKALAEKFGITTPFPSEESLSEEQR